MNILRSHWFLSVLGLIVVLWILVSAAYYAGASGITVQNRGAEATIDFMRQYDFPTFELSSDLALELNTYDGEVRSATVLRVKRAPIPLCWLCGWNTKNGALVAADYRQRSWYYRKPRTPSVNDQHIPDKDWVRTLAYNVESGERVMLALDAPPEAQAAELERLGLVMNDEHEITFETVMDLQPASMLSEGCVVFQVAFGLVIALWVVLGGLVWALTRRRGTSSLRHV